MTSVQFYHLLTSPLERALPKLLEKAYKGGFTTLLVTEDDPRVAQLNELLWTYDPASFLPHGASKDGNSESQPVFLSTSMEPVNNANILVVTSGQTVDKPERFDKILDLFDGNDPESVAHARQRWTAYKENGLSLSYMRQTERGNWEQKATA